MRHQHLIIIVTLLLIYLNYYGITCTEENTNPILIVLSFDAFRRSYLTEDVTFFLKRFHTKGVLANNMGNVFPTKTFTNHFSIATGKYAGSHGVTGNEVYDHELGYLKYSNELFHYDKNITPIWILNELQGKHSGVMMWPGGDFRYKDTFPTYFEALDKNMTTENRTDIVMSWITDPVKPANLVMFYVDQPDETGHAYSPDSQQERDMIKQVDAVIVYLQNRIAFENLQDRVDIIILSDHGMITTTPSQFIDLYKFVDKNVCEMYGTSPVLQVICKENRHDEACQNLTNAANEMNNFKAYTDDELPKRWNVRNQQRFGHCAVVAEPPWAFQDMFEYAKWFKDNHGIEITENTKYGIHGYDNTLDSMKPIFMAQGPSFKNGAVIDDEFNNVDLYCLFCRLQKLNCIPTEGVDRSHVWNAMLKSDYSCQ